MCWMPQVYKSLVLIKNDLHCHLEKYYTICFLLRNKQTHQLIKNIPFAMNELIL